jgi:hypothetical protein
VGKANGKGHRWFQLYWYALSSFSLHSSCDNPFPLPPFPALYFTRTNRPRNNEVILSLLHCVEAVGFTANVNMLGTSLLGWRSHDLNTAYIPFVGGTASCRSKCRARGWCRSILPGCRYLYLCRERARIETSHLGLGDGQAHESSSGDIPTQVSSVHRTTSHSCVETGLILILKGIKSVEDTHAAIDAHMINDHLCIRPTARAPELERASTQESN